MKPPPAVVPANIRFDDDGTPHAPDFADVYHPRAGALQQARHVFLGGNGLPQRWRGRSRFVVLEAGFGLGHNFLATWAAWRDDPARCERLWFVSIDRHPPRRDDLARAHAASPLPELSARLVAQWPPLTPDLHRIAFDDGRVMLQLMFADVAQALPSLRLAADAICLDGFAPDRNPAMWNRMTLKVLARLAAPEATAATWSAARAVREGLTAAGFDVRSAPGSGGKRDISVARFAPVCVPRRAPPSAVPPGEVLIVGGGLAGAACARALAEEGFDCTVLDRHAEPAAEASGNPAGLFHGVVHPDDGPHARLNRSAALLAARVFAPWIEQGRVPGRLDGALRFDKAGVETLRAQAAALGLPPDYVQVLDAAQASALAGIEAPSAAWSYPAGGWLDPAALVRAQLDHPRIRWRGGCNITALERTDSAWRLRDGAGRELARAGTVVLANGYGAVPLLGSIDEAGGTDRADGPHWACQALGRRRGQLTVLPAETPGVVAPRRPLAGNGYAMTLPDGRVLCGATSTAGDDEPALRDADQAHNLERLAALTASRPSAVSSQRLPGRVAWRCVSDDRLPLAGAVPTLQQPQRCERLRDVARRPGLFVCTGLGSRGIAWGPLLGALVASSLSGAPGPLPAPLADALDPARFLLRRMRRSGFP